MSIGDLPAVNAALNAACATLLVAGYRFIRRRDVDRHRRCMLAAFVLSVLFLTSYLVYHYQVGSTRFPGVGWIRSLYLGLLVSHVVLAATVPLLAVVTLWRGLRGDVVAHRRIARWTLPTWLYVSVTGVLVYWMLYHLYGANVAAAAAGTTGQVLRAGGFSLALPVGLQADAAYVPEGNPPKRRQGDPRTLALL